MVLHVISLYCMVLHGIVLYLFFCTVSHCHVSLLQRAGELPRSASSHFYYYYFFDIVCCTRVTGGGGAAGARHSGRASSAGKCIVSATARLAGVGLHNRVVERPSVVV